MVFRTMSMPTTSRSCLSRAGCRCIIPYLRGYGCTQRISPDTLRSGEQAARGADLLALLDAAQIQKAVLAGYDWGGRAACVVTSLWPERVTGLVSSEPGYNIQEIANAGNPIAPEAVHRLWYQYYLHGARGYAGLEANRDAFCRLLWKQWSPTWVSLIMHPSVSAVLQKPQLRERGDPFLSTSFRLGRQRPLVRAHSKALRAATWYFCANGHLGRLKRRRYTDPG